MKTDTGKLVQTKKGFQVNLPTKKGSSNFPIPEAAACFSPSDAEDGMEVEVQRDDANRIVKVTIPGKAEVAPKVTQPKGHGGKGGRGPRGGTGGRGNRGRGSGQGQRGGYRDQSGGGQTSRRKLKKASPKLLGLGFHNPYTFIPFTDVGVARAAPTLQTADENTKEDTPARYTGLIRLTITTQSKLLACAPTPVNGDADHKEYRALCIGNDVIVPATGIRGSLRTLMTVLTGGTLGYLNTETFLCQGRDAALGPRGKNSPPGTPLNCFLAKVIRAGNAHRSGTVRLGETKLVSLEALARFERDLDKYRKPGSKPLFVELDADGKVRKVHRSKDKAPSDAWQLRLSGRPVNRKGKREAVFRDNGAEITLPGPYWAEYSARYAHGDRIDIRDGDLVWLEPSNKEAEEYDLQTASDIESIQWSRWGRHGTKLERLVREKHSHVMPDSITDDGKVDTVTDLFGQVPTQKREAKQDSKTDSDENGIPSFAGRIMPENLVFLNAASSVQSETLAPLAPPHPGCVAMYRDNDHPDNVSAIDGLRGYKVYRTTNETGDKAPWKFSVQGVFDDFGNLKKDHKQKVNKTCDLLPADKTGRLTISFRSLTSKELALLLQACDVPWRLGGGKPFGLGLCEVRVNELLDEEGETLSVREWEVDGQPMQIHDRPWKSEVQDIQSRVSAWVASQQPVDKLRYPRAVAKNKNKNSRGGHVWYQRHAQPRMVVAKDGGHPEPGVSPMYIDGKLLKSVRDAGADVDNSEPMVSGQILPPFDAENPMADQLFGYDGYGVDVDHRKRPTRNVYLQYEPFDPTRHVTGKEKSGGSHGKDSQYYKDQKKRGKKKG